MAKSYSTSTDISLFFDHRQYLNAVIDELRIQGVFSHRTFNRECGFASPNFLQLVIQGKRNLSEAALKQVAKTLNLTKEETRALLRMREMNLESDPETRFGLFQSLLSEPAFAGRYELSQAQLTFYSKWFNVPIRELLQSHPHLDAETISSVLIPKVSLSEIEASLKSMTELGFVSFTKSDGWKVHHRQISTPNEILSQALVHFHSSMIEIAKESLSRFPGAKREVSSVTLQLTEEEFLMLRERIREFKKETLAHETTTSNSQVYQFNFQLFPVTQKIEGPAK